MQNETFGEWITLQECLIQTFTWQPITIRSPNYKLTIPIIQSFNMNIHSCLAKPIINRGSRRPTHHTEVEKNCMSSCVSTTTAHCCIARLLLKHTCNSMKYTPVQLALGSKYVNSNLLEQNNWGIHILVRFHQEKVGVVPPSCHTGATKCKTRGNVCIGFFTHLMPSLSRPTI